MGLPRSTVTTAAYLSLPKTPSCTGSTVETSHLAWVEAVGDREFGKRDTNDNTIVLEDRILTHGETRRSTVGRSSSRRTGVPMMQTADLRNGDDLAS